MGSLSRHFLKAAEQSLSKLNTGLPYDPEILPREMKTYAHTKLAHEHS